MLSVRIVKLEKMLKEWDNNMGECKYIKYKEDDR